MSRTNVVVRDEAFDGPPASELLTAFASEIASLYPGWQPGAGPSANPDEFAPPSGRFMVAYAEGRPVGCAGIKRLDDRCSEIKRLYVAPDARQSGVARLLLDSLEDFARESGQAVVRLDTGDRQPQALALFRSAGYEAATDYNGNPFASYWLEKHL